MVSEYQPGATPAVPNPISEAKRNDLLRRLNDLAETLRDDEKAYQMAARDVQREEFKEMLARGAEKRGKLKTAVQAEVARLGGNPETTGSVMGSLQRGWMELKTALSGGDAAAVLKVCAAADRKLLELYDETLAVELPNDLRNLLAEQRNAVADALKQLEESVER